MGPTPASARWWVPLALSAALGLVIAACGGSAANVATQDAAAGCQGLARSSGKLSPLSLSIGYRLTGASNLGLAGAGEDTTRYGNLSNPMKTIGNDVSTNASKAITADVAIALAVCKTDNLPSK